jgi:hypothetical protein
MNYQPINFRDKFDRFAEQWQPRVVAEMILIEPRGVQNTGGQGGERTAPNDVWI